LVSTRRRRCRPDAYTIVARIEGFQEQTRDVDLGVAQTIAINFRLNIGAVAESLTVTGAAPLIDTARVSVGQVMAERTVQEIPLNGRHFVDLGPLMPGGITPPQNAGLSAPLRGQGTFSFMSAGNRNVGQLHDQWHQPERSSNSQITFQPSINTVSNSRSTTRPSAPMRP
jgi:hypothetical protein